MHPMDAAVVWGWQERLVFADPSTPSFDQDVGMDLANVDFHDLRPDEKDAVRSLITDDGTVVGTGTVIRRDAMTAEIVRRSVVRRYRRTGLGRRLVEELVATAHRWGMSRVVLETSAHWTDVVEFYLRCGFTQTHFESGSFGRDVWFELKWDSATIREAALADDAVIDAIAREGDASADAEYLALVRSQAGRLLVAELAGKVVAYGGVVEPAWRVTDPSRCWPRHSPG